MKKEKVSFKLNPERIKYLLALYNLDTKAFIELIHSNVNRKTQAITKTELEYLLKQPADVDIKLLKLIDKTFQKGLTWYISKSKLPALEGSSIFFRKEKFNSELDFESRKKINEFEQRKIEIQTLCKYIKYKPKRLVKKYSVSDNAQDVAIEIREEFSKVQKNFKDKDIIRYPKNAREFLKYSIRMLELFNLFVFEFVEPSNKKNKVTFSGYYSSPNIIVLKRLDYTRREIFTLFHEFAHYLLDTEEIDDIYDYEFRIKNRIEKWCHSFAFNFLLGENLSKFYSLNKAKEENRFNEDEIKKIYYNSFLSYSALYTRLLIEKKITEANYNKIIHSINKIIEQKKNQKKERAKTEIEIAKERGEEIHFFPRKPIESNLFKEIVKLNYFEGNINESKLRDFLHISDKKSIDSVIY